MTLHRITLKTSDISALEGISMSRASESHSTLKASLSKSKKQKVTIREYCADRGFDYNQTLVDLGLKRPVHETV